MFLFNNSDMYNVFVQGIGVLGIIAGIISFQCKKHKNIMIFRTANEMLFAVQYFFLGAYTGVAMNVFGSLRNMVFMDMVKKDKNTMFMRYVFSGIFLLFMALTWGGTKKSFERFGKSYVNLCIWEQQYPCCTNNDTFNKHILDYI